MILADIIVTASVAFTIGFLFGCFWAGRRRDEIDDHHAQRNHHTGADRR